MPSLHVLAQPSIGPNDEARDIELDSAICDEAAALVTEIREALAKEHYERLGNLAHPLAIRREHARLARLFGQEAAGTFWSNATSRIEAVRMVGNGAAEIYEHVQHHPTKTAMRFCSVAEHVKGAWRLLDAREAWDERLTAVVLRGSPPETSIDIDRWMRRWERAHGATATLRMEQHGRALLSHPDHGWTAIVRIGSGRDLARILSLGGSEAALLEKQPAATLVSMVPALNANERTEQLRWLARAVVAFGARDASSVWVPTAQKAIPFSTWITAVEGTLSISVLSALWTRTQRQEGAWVTRGMTHFMLPEIEVCSVGLMVATVRELLRMSAGRLLRHHAERAAAGLGASAPAVPAVAARLYSVEKQSLSPMPNIDLESSIAIGTSFAVGEVEALLRPGRQGPRQGESYGRWGSVALRSEPAWWLGVA